MCHNKCLELALWEGPYNDDGRLGPNGNSDSDGGETAMASVRGCSRGMVFTLSFETLAQLWAHGV